MICISLHCSLLYPQAILKADVHDIAECLWPKIKHVVYSEVKTARETCVALSPGWQCGIACKRISTEDASFSWNEPEASSRFCCLSLLIKEYHSKLVEKLHSGSFPLTSICFQNLKDHLLCFQICKKFTLLILQVMSIINWIQYTLRYTSYLLYFSSLLV